jgi:hypothetical protein
MAKTDDTDGFFGLRMPFGGLKEAAEAFQVCFRMLGYKRRELLSLIL